MQRNIVMFVFKTTFFVVLARVCRVCAMAPSGEDDMPTTLRAESDTATTIWQVIDRTVYCEYQVCLIFNFKFIYDITFLFLITLIYLPGGPLLAEIVQDRVLITLADNKKKLTLHSMRDIKYYYIILAGAPCNYRERALLTST